MVNWNEGTAIGTLLLAGATFVLARKTNKTASAAEAEVAQAIEQNKTMASQVRVTRQQIRRSQMPVVMPVSDPTDVLSPQSLLYGGRGIRGVVPTAEEASDEPENSAILSVPIVNVGSGPAFTITATIQFLDAAGNRSVAGQPMTERAAVLTALGAGAPGVLRARFRALALPFLPFAVSISFDDAFGGTYKVTGTFFPDQQAYRDIVFNAPEDLSPT